MLFCLVKATGSLCMLSLSPSLPLPLFLMPSLLLFPPPFLPPTPLRQTRTPGVEIAASCRDVCTFRCRYLLFCGWMLLFLTSRSLSWSHLETKEEGTRRLNHSYQRPWKPPFVVHRSVRIALFQLCFCDLGNDPCEQQPYFW